ncbi:hypothetical protein [Yinghuangia seranimata]|uniref:hypothetical protein n=1 Tax=Yinghuangia seranimata TaxID=408067 RepID=UPI00248C3553|nr:hypothetical protein [Yinghuangia seranimata]MDI2125104.1 hypothetical protein [Yinghuangia seranimata]
MTTSPAAVAAATSPSPTPFPVRVRRATAAWGAARIALGVVAITAPPVVSRPWIGRDVQTTGGTVFAKALGVRDIALGAGTTAAAFTGKGLSAWALASAAADVGDTLITRHHWPDLPRTRVGIAALAGASALTGVALAAAHALTSRQFQPRSH